MTDRRPGLYELLEPAPRLRLACVDGQQLPDPQTTPTPSVRLAYVMDVLYERAHRGDWSEYDVEALIAAAARQGGAK